MSFDHVGTSFVNLGEFRRHVKECLSPWAEGCTVHHTHHPSLEMRPHGLTDQHIRNIRHYYINARGWASGPHIFIDDHRVMLMTPLDEKGIHATSFNSSRIGVEVLGNYDVENPKSGRGLKCWTLAMEVVRILAEENGFPPLKYNFHRHDPRTSKTCPGTLVTTKFLDSMITGDQPPRPDSEAELERLGEIAIYEVHGKHVTPIAESLFSLGVDGAFDAGNWDGITIVYYDEASETSFGLVDEVLAKA